MSDFDLLQQRIDGRLAPLLARQARWGRQGATGGQRRDAARWLDRCLLSHLQSAAARHGNRLAGGHGAASDGATDRANRLAFRAAALALLKEVKIAGQDQAADRSSRIAG